jgi:hypothetical protein
MSRPAYGVPPRTRPDRLSWPRVLARMLLVVLPGQLLGNVGYALAGAGVGIAVFVLLLGLAQLRLPAISPGASVGDFLLGALVVAVVQIAVALPLWWRRSDPR